VVEDTAPVGATAPRTLHVIASDARRGAETYAVQLVAALRDHGDGARLVALVASDDPTAHDVPVLGSARRAPQTLRRLRAEAAEADVVVAHGSSTLEACASSLVGHSTPFVYRTIGDPSYWVTTPLRRRAVGVMLRRATRHVALWGGAADQLTSRYGVPRDRIDVIPNAVPSTGISRPTEEDRIAARERFAVPPDAVCLGFVGALAPEKAVATAVDACAAIDGARLLVAGDGPDRAELRRYARQVARGRVHFLGALEAPAEVYVACDLLLLPSRSEGMPAVVIEAALRERATVATAVGSLPGVVDDGTTGFLVSTSDPTDFVETVRAALADARDVGRAAADSLGERLTMERTLEPWVRSLQQASRTETPQQRRTRGRGATSVIR
jgi:glycosyltransferase involved in cell wall biosynthesis